MNENISLLLAVSTHRDDTVETLLAASVEVRQWLAPQLVEQKGRWLAPILQRLPRGDQPRIARALETSGWSGPELRASFTNALWTESICGWSREQTCKLVDELERSGAFADPLGLRKRASDDGRLRPLLESAKLLDLGRVTEIGDACLEPAAAAGLRADQLSPPALERAVANGVLGRDVARSLGFAANLVTWTGDEAAARRLAKADLPAGSPRHVRDFALLPPDAWQKLACAIDLKNAAELRATLERVFPGEAIISRLAPPDAKTLAADIEAVDPVLRQNPDALSGPLGAEAGAPIGRLRTLVRRFPHLGVGKVLLEAGEKPSQRAARVIARIESVFRLATASAGSGLFELDLDAGSDDLRVLAADTVDDQELPGVVATLRTYRAIAAIAGNAASVVALIDAGLDTPAKIAKTPMRGLQEAKVLSPVQAAQIKQAARAKLIDWAGPTGTLLGMFGSGSLIPIRGANNVPPAAIGGLRQHPELEDLLGRLDFCRCQECQSLLSPAAYFVDLMLFLEEHVLSEASYRSAAGSYDLRTRRPDLWTLRLDCDAIHGTLPTLDIVNDVLEQYLAGAAVGICSARDALDAAARAERERLVYGERLGAPLSPGATAAVSVQQPSMLPQLEVDLLMAALDEDRASLVRDLGGAGAAFAAAQLRTSQAELPLVRSDVIAVTRLFGPNAPSFASSSLADRPDASMIAQRLHLSHEELAAVIATRFVRGASGEAGLRTVRTKGALQPDREIVDGLTIQTLGRLHRFVRLWRRVRGEPGELDLLLGALHDADGLSGDRWDTLLADGLEQLTALRQLQQLRPIGVEDLAAFVGRVPTTPIRAGARSLFDQRFSQLQPGTFVHPHTTTPDAALADAVAKQTAWLSGGCGVSVETLSQLIVALRPALEPASDNPAIAFKLNAANLTLLYRHARAMALLGLGVSELFSLLRLRARTHLAGLAELEVLLQTHDTWRASGLSLESFVWTLERDRPAVDLESLTAAMVGRSVADQPLLFAPTLLALVPEVSPELSTRVVTRSAAFVRHDATGRYRLADGFDPATAIPLPLDFATTDQERRALAEGASAIENLLGNHRPANVIASLAAGPLGRAAGEVRRLAQLGAVDLADATLVPELLGDAEPVGLRGRIASLAHAATVFSSWSEAALSTLVEHPESAGFVAGSPPTWDVLVRLRSVREFVEDTDIETARVRRAVVAGYSATAGLAAVSDEELAGAYSATSSLVRAAELAVGRSARAADVLPMIARWVRAAQRLGIDVAALRQLTATHANWTAEFGAMVVVRSALRSAIAARAEGAPAVDVKKVDDTLRGRKRDALTEHLLTAEPDRFPRRTSLYHYFLIDTETEGCARTSCVVSATSALQLFVQRILMGLEGNPTTTVDPDLVPADAWSWRRQYRLWEANRKIFLYPENYLLPELRDDKTPLFETLEADLLSSEITQQRVVDAYATYVTGLDELGRLSIAGSYQEQSGSRDVLHLFGVNSDDPPVYYYRRVENLHAASQEGDGRGLRFDPWRRIDVKIPVRIVSPTVVSGRLYLLWVETRTRNDTDVAGGTSRFIGYRHELSLRFAMLRLDGTWTPAQQISLDHTAFPDGHGVVLDPLVSATAADFEPPGASSGTPRERLARLMADIGGLPIGFCDSLLDERLVRILTRSNRSLHERVDAFLDGAALRDDALVVLANDLLAVVGFPSTLVAERDGRSTPVFHGRGGEKPEPFDGYTLTGYLWDRVFPSGTSKLLRVSLAGFRVRQRHVDLYRRRLKSTRLHSKSPRYPTVASLDGYALHAVSSTRTSPFAFTHTPLSWATTWSSRHRVRELAYETDRHDITWRATYESFRESDVLLTLTKDGTLEPCGGYPQNAVLDLGSDLLLLVGSPWEGESYQLRRLGSTLTSRIAEQLFTEGLEGLLALEFQVELAEGPAPVSFPTGTVSRVIHDRTGDGGVDFSGPFGVYYGEIFFHTPFAIASALHASGDFAGAQRWLHYLFDPGGAPLEGETASLDRVWRYRELRGLTFETLESKLSDPAALAAYENDPFNPHAIARLRPTAYQNAIVMKYMDVLLDWADSLFAQFTRESLNEAGLLYILVSDLLGDKPNPVGDCLDGEVGTFDAILPQLREAESTFAAAPPPSPRVKGKKWKKPKKSNDYMVGPSWLEVADPAEPEDVVTVQAAATFAGDWSRGHTESIGARDQLERGQLSVERLLDRASDQLVSIARQVGTFCVPPNPKLLAYWDRVADRLFKLRNCLDLQGQRRELPLFAPPIDPLLLARMRAAGLTLDDVLGGGPGEVPPYRFAVLISRAQSAAGTLQGLGNALLSALEKRDNEQLSQLRNRHQQNLVRLGIRAMEQEIESAALSRQLAEAQLEAAEYRRDYYRALLDEGLSASEQSQQDNTNLALTFKVQAAYWELIAGVVHLIPELGSPFALKFGGKQIGDAAGAIGGAFRTLGGIADASSQAAGIQASFYRRQQGWRNELGLADRGVAQQQLQVEAAILREEIAKQRMKSHEESLAQAEEVRDFFEDKLTNYSLYEWYATTLTRLFRQAFEGALAMARLAERAFAFERLDDATRLSHEYWDPTHRGLLAGERLAADLGRLERRFVETDFRSLEVDQTFSLSQIDPDALWRLKQTGECTFTIGERFFDLSYPGHYRRRIKAVRLTIPAVIGPYTNVSATLELTGSRCEVNPGEGYRPLPAQHSTRIATSRAQNDAGVFELSFNDARYLPFEGAGAISDWSLRLPRTFRTFDYQAIDDVLVHVAYTARHDEMLRDAKMADAEELSRAVALRLGSQAFMRIISFRHELGPVLRRLLDSPAGTPIPFTLKPEHLPYYMRGLPLSVTSATLYVRGAPADVSLSLDGAAVTGFATDGSASLLGALPGRDVTRSFAGGWLGDHTIAAAAGGSRFAAEDVLLGLVLLVPSE